MEITTDFIEIYQIGPITLNATILFTWIVMVILVGGTWLITRNISSGMHLSRGQNLLEVLLSAIKDQIREISQQEKVDKYLPFVGTLFIFIAAANVLSIIPGFRSPTGSLSTTAALALCVFVAVPVYGIWQQGLKGYFKRYLQPSIMMLPFNIIGEFSRTLTLAMRLYGNIMSGGMIVAILISLVPLFVPLIMQVFGLLIGLIQAYVFSILAMVYIAAATESSDGQGNQANEAA
jgi:F-type H+-transporting ATPase subunit a